MSCTAYKITINFLCRVRSCCVCICISACVCVCNESGVAVWGEVCQCGGWVITVDINPADGLAGGIRRSGGVAQRHLWTVTIWSSSSPGLTSVCFTPATHSGHGNTCCGMVRRQQSLVNGWWSFQVESMLLQMLMLLWKSPKRHLIMIWLFLIYSLDFENVS